MPSSPPPSTTGTMSHFRRSIQINATAHTTTANQSTFPLRGKMMCNPNQRARFKITPMIAAVTVESADDRDLIPRAKRDFALKNLQLITDKLCLIRWPPSGGRGPDWVTEAFEDNFAQVFEEESLAKAQLGNCVRHQDLFRSRVVAETGGQLNR